MIVQKFEIKKIRKIQFAKFEAKSPNIFNSKKNILQSVQQGSIPSAAPKELCRDVGIGQVSAVTFASEHHAKLVPATVIFYSLPVETVCPLTNAQAAQDRMHAQMMHRASNVCRTFNLRILKKVLKT